MVRLFCTSYAFVIEAKKNRPKFATLNVIITKNYVNNLCRKSTIQRVAIFSSFGGFVAAQLVNFETYAKNPFQCWGYPYFISSQSQTENKREYCELQNYKRIATS